MYRYDSLDMTKEEVSKVGQGFFLLYGGTNRYLFKFNKNKEPERHERILVDECEVPFKVLAIGDSKVDDSVIYVFTEVLYDEVPANSN